MREEPYLKANLEIVEARSLVGKDMSGSSDPFCTCYLTTNPISRFNTSYKVDKLLRWLNLTGCFMCSQSWDGFMGLFDFIIVMNNYYNECYDFHDSSTYKLKCIL